MEILIRGIAAGIAASLLALVIKKTNDEFSIALSLITSAGIVALSLGFIGAARELIDFVSVSTGLSPALVQPVLRCVGIGVITRIGSDICRDAGAGAIASSVEILGAGAALYISLPLMRTLIDMVGGLM